MHTQSLPNTAIEDRRFLEIFVLEWTQSPICLTKDANLLLVDLLLDIRSLREMKKAPRHGSGRSVLSSHQQSDHDVRNLDVVESSAVAVLLVGQGSKHVVFMFMIATAAFLDDPLIELGHSSLLQERKSRMRRLNRRILPSRHVPPCRVSSS